MSLSHKATYFWLFCAIFAAITSLIAGKYSEFFIWINVCLALILLALEERDNAKVHTKQQ